MIHSRGGKAAIAIAILFAGDFVGQAVAQPVVPSSSAQVLTLSDQIVLSAKTAEAAAPTVQPIAQRQGAIEGAILDSLTASGASTEVATAALKVALLKPGLSPTVVAAINAVLGTLQASQRLETGALGDGVSLFEAPPSNTGGGGGSSYR